MDGSGANIGERTMFLVSGRTEGCPWLDSGEWNESEGRTRRVPTAAVGRNGELSLISAAYSNHAEVFGLITL